MTSRRVEKQLFQLLIIKPLINRSVIKWLQNHSDYLRPASSKIVNKSQAATQAPVKIQTTKWRWFLLLDVTDWEAELAQSPSFSSREQELLKLCGDFVLVSEFVKFVGFDIWAKRLKLLKYLAVQHRNLSLFKPVIDENFTSMMSDGESRDDFVIKGTRLLPADAWLRF